MTSVNSTVHVRIKQLAIAAASEQQ